MSWTSSSSRVRASALAAAVAIVAAGCAGRRPPRAAGAIAPGQRVAVLPPANTGGTQAPLDALHAEVARLAGRAGLEVVSGAPVEAFLAAHRIRSTAGLDREGARAAREDLHVDAVIVTSVDLWAPGAVPKVALSMRLVSVAGEPTVDWIDAAARAGDDAPGAFGLGITTSVEQVGRDALAELSRSFAAYVRGAGPRAPTCDASGTFLPKIAFRSPALAAAGRPATVAVLPFLDATGRRGGGSPVSAVSLEFARHLVANPRFRVLEPGVVRAEVIRFRIVQEDGVSLEQARLLLDVLDADLVVAGEVRDLDDAIGAARPPTVGFTVQVLERAARRVVWESASRNGGDDAISLFGSRRVRTANGLACRMVANVVRGMDSGGRGTRETRGPRPVAVSAPAQHGADPLGPTQPLREPNATIDRKTTVP